MRFRSCAIVILALVLIACSGSEEPTPELRPEDTPIETPEDTESSTTRVSTVPKSPDNTLIETPEYRGVVFSKKRATEFGFLFDTASTDYWEPSVNDVARAEACIRRILVSVQDDAKDYRREHAAFILENLGNYRRQYVGIVVDGEKRIWTNAFFSDDSHPDWMRSPVYVLDGGHHYWQIDYDPLKDECTNFYVHGEA
jgi:hypothetical protein